jgi:hypothetical protein
MKSEYARMTLKLTLGKSIKSGKTCLSFHSVQGPRAAGHINSIRLSRILRIHSGGLSSCGFVLIESYGMIPVLGYIPDCILMTVGSSFHNPYHC